MDSMVDPPTDGKTNSPDRYPCYCLPGSARCDEPYAHCDRDARRDPCTSAYNAGRGLWLHCTGEHLRGNIFRGEVHQQRYAGAVWTWYDDEAHATRSGDV